MDKIRDNLFGIGAGLGAVVFLVLLYFAVIDPILTLTGEGDESVKTQLDRSNNELKKFGNKNAYPNLPSDDLRKSEDTHQKHLKDAMAEAQAFYDKSIAEAFNSFPDPFAESKDSPAGFNATYTTELDNLKKIYLATFKPASAPAPAETPPADGAGKPETAKPPESGPPPEAPRTEGKKEKDAGGLSVAQMDINTEADIPRAMKEFLVIRKVFRSLEKLELGGLKAIEFPRGQKETPSPSPLYKVMDVKVTVEAPAASVEPLVSGLLDLTLPEGQIGQAPLLLKSVSMTRKPETLLKSRMVQKDYDSIEAAQKDTLLPGEPDVVAEINLWAIEWQGLPKEEKIVKK